MAAIDIGAPAIDRDILGSEGWTRLNKENPANLSGTITSIEIWVASDVTGCKVGTFYQTNGGTYKCRASEAIPGTIVAGAKRTYAVSIEVEAGDLLGEYHTGGNIERDGSGGEGTWAIQAEHIDPDDEATYTSYAGQTISCYGIGTEPAVAPTVTTQAVSAIGTTTATGNGNITDNGGENCSKRGVCWNIGGNPTVADDKSEETDSFGTGAFTRSMTSLASPMKYYVKAYAYNSAGYGYGAQVTFTTKMTTSVIVGNLVSATKVAGDDYHRASSTLIGNLVSAARVYGRLRISAVITGIVASTVLRSWGRVRASLVLIGNLVTASRGLGTFTRTATTVLIGNLVTATRKIEMTMPSATAIIGTAVTATQGQITLLRTSSVIAGIVVTTKRTYLTFTRASSTIIGIVTTAKAVTGVQRAIVYIGIYLTANRNITKQFAASVIVGIVATASRIVTYTITAVTVVGIVVTAITRQWGRFRTSAVIVGAVSVASKVVAYHRNVAVVTFYPNAHPETSSVDGVVQHILVYGTWAQIRDGDGNVFNDTIDAYSCAGVFSGLNINEWWRIYRSIFLFDISALPPGAIIVTVTLTLYGEGKSNALGDPAINVYSANPVSNTELVGTDYSTLGSTPLATQINYADWIGSFDEGDPQPNVFTLNAAGIAIVQAAVEGILKLGVREVNFDVGNSAPDWQANKSSRFQGYFADQGKLLKPKLMVTYTSPTLFPPTIISITVSVTRALTFTRQATTRVGAVITAFGLRVGRLLKMVVFGRDYYDTKAFTRPQYDMEVSNDIH